MDNYSDYIIYVDESGDHNLLKVDSKYPVFVLVFCIFEKSHYADKVTPDMQKLKFKHFGHDLVVMHEREIRKNQGCFDFLMKEDLRIEFMDGINRVIEESDMTIISSIIDKTELKAQYTEPDNPYKLSLLFCLERAYKFLEEKNRHEKTTYIVFESRGKKEDDQLELEFRRICDKNNNMKANLPFEIVFANKQCNSTGLQLADLIARPIGYHALKPNQTNRAYQTLYNRFYRSQSGKVNGYGLKQFP
ncbi:MAG: DUF3800 domain-containing protein [Candidatus Caenarcaniphilales bacterium]|nr:DUF3800 domain-containing protein [Candidatus Caenarcaniphilales bacterium]